MGSTGLRGRGVELSRVDTVLGTLEQLRDELAEGRRQTLEVASIDQVCRAVGWLKASRREGGFWGEGQEGTTALAMLALQSWASAGDRAGAAAASAADFDLGPSAAWLSQQAEADGRWRTPWYTGVAVQALVRAGYRGPEIERGRAHISTFDPDNDQYWPDRVHHAAQILAALGTLGCPMDVRRPWAECILRHLSLERGAYVCGQAVHALAVWSDVSRDRFQEIINGLHGYLAATGLSKSSFVDYMPALLALAAADDVDAELLRFVRGKTPEILARMEDTSWYRDPEMTAWALLALYQVGSVTQVVVPSAAFADAFSRARVSLPLQAVQDRRRTAAYTAALFTLLILVVALVVTNPTDSVLVDVTIALLVVALIPITATLLRLLR